MVMKPTGVRYEYLTPSSMVATDLEGNVVDGAGFLLQTRLRTCISTVICLTCIRCGAYAFDVCHGVNGHWSGGYVWADDDG